MVPGATGGASARDALAAATDAFAAIGIDTPRIDAETLLSGITGRSAADLIAGRDTGIAPAEARAFSEAVRRRLRREPVAYILGRKGFRHIELAVDPRVLIPRPETEMLVELALELEAGSVLDIGTGSGAVALAVADEIPGCRVQATDTSSGALEVARANARMLGLAGRVDFSHGTWPAPGRFDLILGNLPYVAEDGPVAEDVAAWEPQEALFAGRDGLDVLREVLGTLPDSGVETEAVGLEIGFDQGESASRLVAAAGFARTEVRRDLAGIDRLVVGRR
jgi:release factor glutamine methyltransferase